MPDTPQILVDAIVANTNDGDFTESLLCNHRLKPMIPFSSQDSRTFSFKPESLAQKLEQESDFSLTGYWHHQFQPSSQEQAARSWYLGLLAGKAIFSDSQPLSVSRWFATIERYVPRLKSDRAKQLTETLKQRFMSKDEDRQLENLAALLNTCYSLGLVRPEEVKQALRLKILQDLDDVLFEYAGQAEFVPTSDLTQAPIIGFDLKELLSEARKRKLIWNKVKTVIPTSDSILTMNHEAVLQANLTPRQEQRLRALIAYGETINAISVAVARDTLEIAKGLAQLVNKGLLTIQSTVKQCEPEIVIIDDSPLMLQQFRMLVSGWGYQVRPCADPTSALEVMTQTNPIAIFIDVNMPGLSGFELLKQIRRQPKLAQVPLIMLTAERTLSNNWRAQWSGCQFLSKPLSPEEIPQFKYNLRLLLETTAS